MRQNCYKLVTTEQEIFDEEYARNFQRDKHGNDRRFFLTRHSPYIYNLICKVKFTSFQNVNYVMECVVYDMECVVYERQYGFVSFCPRQCFYSFSARLASRCKYYCLCRTYGINNVTAR